MMITVLKVTKRNEIMIPVIVAIVHTVEES